MENIGCTLIILLNINGAAVLSDAGGATQENKVARGNEHVAETNIQTACPVPSDSTYRDAQPAKYQDPHTPRTGWKVQFTHNLKHRSNV